MVKYLIMDVDGTLTDGKIYFGNNGEQFKAFNIKDGYAIAHLLRAMEIEPIIITGRQSQIVELRCKELGISKIFQGKMNKLEILKSILDDANDGLNSCAYIGDDIPDYECMQKIKSAGGYVGCPSDAIKKIIEISDFVSSKNAGDGAVREFVEWIESVEGR